MELDPRQGGNAVRTRELIPDAETVAILDGGAQYALDIEQQIKRLGHNAVRIPFDTPIEELYRFGGIILSGGPESVYDDSSPRTDPRLFTERDGRPAVLGICYGDQLINHVYGGKVEKLPKREDGFTRVSLLGNSALSKQVEINDSFVMSHGDTITELAPGFRAVAYSGELIAGIANDEERMYGVQFHPEVSPPAGPEVLDNFLKGICELEGNYVYTYEDFIEDARSEVREFVGNRQVLAYISGGVDSSALAKLLQEALPGDQLFLVLVDHGFMREDEINQVVAMLAESGVDITVYDATEDYENATTFINGVETDPLSTVADPEIKRSIIGDNFITIQDKIADILGLDPDNYVLAMGSLYTDLIESGSKIASNNAATIKTHHNDTELVRKMREEGRVLEPWRFTQKDGVRAVGKLLGLHEEIYTRQPFPGPGLAIRVICGDLPYETNSTSDVEMQLRNFETSDIKVDLLPIKSVGVQGDQRTYAHAVALSGPRDWARLIDLANDIPRDVHDVNRVAYVFGEPIEGGLDSLTPTFLTSDVVTELKTVDTIVNHKLQKYGLDKTLSQVPVILLPLHFGEDGKRSVVLRTFITETEFKTGRAAIPGVDFPEFILDEIVEELLQLPGIARVLYDLTSKPPGTTEWE